MVEEPLCFRVLVGPLFIGSNLNQAQKTKYCDGLYRVLNRYLGYAY